MPKVDGPIECELCHEALHPKSVPDCDFCEEAFSEVLTQAMEASKPVRGQIHQLQFNSWFLGWQAAFVGWAGILTGGALGGWFVGADGATNYLHELFWILILPGIQWVLKSEIKRKQRLLPRLTPEGAISYGDATSDGRGGPGDFSRAPQD